ncbi:hypothetical protein, partial [Salmonella enterica]|uniref:hypothetical protein n=1 Tax=Salmonella enterica TaxID=28901 RepID=UPI003CF5FED2
TEEATEEATEEPTEEAAETPTDEAPQMFALLAEPLLLQQVATTASFTASIGADRTVQFTDTTVTDQTITSWQWDFDDGQTSSEQSP